MESEEQVQLNSLQNFFDSIVINCTFITSCYCSLLYAEKEEIEGLIQVKQLT